jgi:hypothetical protein
MPRPGAVTHARACFGGETGHEDPSLSIYPRTPPSRSVASDRIHHWSPGFDGVAAAALQGGGFRSVRYLASVRPRRRASAPMVASAPRSSAHGPALRQPSSHPEHPGACPREQRLLANAPPPVQHPAHRRPFAARDQVSEEADVHADAARGLLWVEVGFRDQLGSAISRFPTGTAVPHHTAAQARRLAAGRATLSFRACRLWLRPGPERETARRPA